jgi:hypothetical protein
VSANSPILNTGTLDLIRCTISGSSVTDDGGALRNLFGTATLTQCTLSGNSAPFGGALSNAVGKVTLTHCTVAGNSATSGGAIFNYSGGVVTVTNSIVAANSATDASADIFNSSSSVVTLAGTNIIQVLTNDGGTVTGPALQVDPLLAPLDDYGGPNKTRALRPNSPARNAAIGSNFTSDQRSFPIVGVPDVGAYEAGTLTYYNPWIVETAGEAFPFDGDLDFDGASNGLEYALRRNPLQPDVLLSPTLTPTVGGHQFEFRYRATARDLRYIVQRSANLQTWTEIYRYDTSTGLIMKFGVKGEEDPVKELVTITDATGGAELFWRLRVEKVP